MRRSPNSSLRRGLFSPLVQGAENLGTSRKGIYIYCAIILLVSLYFKAILLILEIGKLFLKFHNYFLGGFSTKTWLEGKGKWKQFELKCFYNFLESHLSDHELLELPLTHNARCPICAQFGIWKPPLSFDQ